MKKVSALKFKNKVGIEPRYIISKRGRLKDILASKSSDIIGFDYIVMAQGVCYEYYEAESSLGLTHPMPIKRPLGLDSFSKYKIGYKKAIKLFHSVNCGGRFSSIGLSKVLYPSVKEPHWHFISDMGVHVIVGANTGKVSCKKYKKKK